MHRQDKKASGLTILAHGHKMELPVVHCYKQAESGPLPGRLVQTALSMAIYAAAAAAGFSCCSIDSSCLGRGALSRRCRTALCWLLVWQKAGSRLGCFCSSRGGYWLCRGCALAPPAQWFLRFPGLGQAQPAVQCCQERSCPSHGEGRPALLQRGIVFVSEAANIAEWSLDSLLMAKLPS